MTPEMQETMRKIELALCNAPPYIDLLDALTSFSEPIAANEAITYDNPAGKAIAKAEGRKP